MSRYLLVFLAGGVCLCTGWASGQTSGGAARAPASPVFVDITGYDPTVAPDPEKATTAQPIAILCDPANLRLSVQVSDKASLDRSYPQRFTISPDELIVETPERWGAYRGGLARYARCGPYVIKMAGDLYNPNAGGELGAYPPFIQIGIAANQMGIAFAAIGECERGARRGPKCPDEWATRIDISYDAQSGKTKTRLVTTSVEMLGGPEGRQQTEKHQDVFGGAVSDCYKPPAQFYEQCGLTK